MTDSKNKRNLDSFVEDLDDIDLSLKEAVALIDDEDAIDRLLMADPAEPVVDEINLLEIENNDKFVEQIDELSTPELVALDEVGVIEEFDRKPKATETKERMPDANYEVIHEEIPAEIRLEIETEQHHDQVSLGADQMGFLISQISELQTQQRHLHEDLRKKASKESLADCLEGIAQIQQTQQQQLHEHDSVSPLVEKPVQYSHQPSKSSDASPVMTAYLTSGLAVLSFVVAVFFGLKAGSTESKLENLQQLLDQHQQQLSAMPEKDADNQALKDQLSTLAQSQQGVADQVQALNKGNSASSKSSDEIQKQLAKLTAQNKQSADAIEALENRIVTLEKMRQANAAPVQAPRQDKPQASPDIKKTDKSDTGGQNWFVTLTSSKQDWYAQRKADEYAAKGFPVKLYKVQVKGENWFRLIAEGFKSQQEAEAYMGRVKKTLNLDDVSVGHN